MWYGIVSYDNIINHFIYYEIVLCDQIHVYICDKMSLHCNHSFVNETEALLIPVCTSFHCL